MGGGDFTGNLPASSETTAEARAGQTSVPFHSVMVLGRCLLVLVAARTFLALIGIAVLSSRLAMLSRLTSANAVHLADMTANDHGVETHSIATLVLLLPFLLCLLRWMYFAYRNLGALGARGMSMSPGFAIGSFFIPFINLVRPFQAMSEIWRASDPRTEDPLGWKGRGAPVVGLWWVFWLLESLSGIVGVRVLLSAAAGAAPDVVIERLQLTSVAAIVDNVIGLTGDILLFAIVLTVSRRQEQRAHVLAAESGAAAPATPSWRRPAFAAIGVVVGLGLTAAVMSRIQAGSVVWAEFSPPEGQFKVQMPGNPKHKTQADGDTPQQLYTSDDGASVYVVGYFDVGRSPIANQWAALNALKQDKVQVLQGTLAEERDINVGAQAGQDYVVRNPRQSSSQDMRLRVFIVGNRVFQFIVMGHGTALHNANAEKFFESIYVPGMWQGERTET